MDLSKLEKKLLAAARCPPPPEQVPYAFEKRIMARLASIPKPDEWLWWMRSLWRGAAVCALVAILCSGWSFLGPARHNSSNGASDLEAAVLASVNDPDLAW